MFCSSSRQIETFEDKPWEKSFLKLRQKFKWEKHFGWKALFVLGLWKSWSGGHCARSLEQITLKPLIKGTIIFLCKTPFTLMRAGKAAHRCPFYRDFWIALMNHSEDAKSAINFCQRMQIFMQREPSHLTSHLFPSLLNFETCSIDIIRI